MIAWSQFTPWSALAGGMLIGLATALLLLFKGRIAGISGILGNLLKAPGRDHPWRLVFLAGLLVSPVLYGLVSPLPEAMVSASGATLILAGLLVGFGSRLGAGCTSGHGICGLSRLSLRSLLATMTFMLAGMLTVALLRHW